MTRQAGGGSGGQNPVEKIKMDKKRDTPKIDKKKKKQEIEETEIEESIQNEVEDITIVQKEKREEKIERDNKYKKEQPIKRK